MLKLSPVLLLLCTLACAHPSQRDSDGEFDYVVIGGGTAGLVVAARLTEDPDVTVAVIEAGVYHKDEPLVDTPEFFGQAIGNPDFDWNFSTVPQSGLNNASVFYSRGKMLGGSSGLNFMAWDRGSGQEYDVWETLGATGWNWDSMLPYFKKTETVSPQTPAQMYAGSSEVPESTFYEYHGSSGPVQPSYNVFYSNITTPYVETLNALGIPTNSDPYMGDATGIYNCEMAIDHVKDVGKRSYSAVTYYNSSVEKPNLTIYLVTQATRINFVKDSEGQLQATSVDVTAVNSAGITGTLTARKEVILAAGTVQTPQLLELSGIGNKTILESVGIETLVDLPGVGENLQDQTLVAQDFQLLDTVFTYDELRNNATYLAEQQAEYEANSTGIFASAEFALAFVPANASALVSASGLSPQTKAQYELLMEWLTGDDIAFLEFIMFPTGGRTTVNPAPNSVYITLWTTLMHAFSRGTVHINSTDPLKAPIIDPGFLNNDVDTQLALEGMKFLRKVTESEPLASLIVAPHEPAGTPTDSEWLDYIRKNIGSIYHPVGTAAMLPQTDGGVVDPKKLKVYGTSNLRVVDASVIPLIPATHPSSTVYAIAERAADMIKGLI
ncbi:alcohol oxidase [Daedaleopsis nitida]|nr:alcohol oxidase [Daedaleopsis nitida]